jgi:cystathionine gamma-synthase
MKAFGGMISLKLTGGGANARKFAESTNLFQLAESLGGVESLMCYPAEMTHASVRGTALEVPEDVVRLSVGIEDVDDLLADVLQALDTVK